MQKYSLFSCANHDLHSNEDYVGQKKAFVSSERQEPDNLILSKKTELENVAQALLKYETLDAEDVEKILDGQILDKPTVGDLLAAEQKKTEKTEETETQQQD